MSHTIVPHFKLPLQVGRRNALETVEQDTLDEIAQCVEVLLSTVVEERIELPDYGIPDLAFTVGLPIHELETRIEEWEPRATAVLAENPDLLDELVRQLQVKVTGD